MLEKTTEMLKNDLNALADFSFYSVQCHSALQGVQMYFSS